MYTVSIPIGEDAAASPIIAWLAAVRAAPTPPLWAALADRAIAGGWLDLEDDQDYTQRERVSPPVRMFVGGVRD